MTPFGRYTAPIAQGAPGATELVVAPGEGRRILLTAYVVVSDTGGTVKFRSGASTDKTGAMTFLAGGGISNSDVVVAMDEDEELFVVTATSPVNGHFEYEVVPA